MNINIDLIYPVGAIYLSTVATNPKLLFGGEWEQIQDKFLLSAGSTYTAGKTGGSTTHTHNYGIQVGGYYNETVLAESSNGGVLTYNTSNTPSQTEFSAIGSLAALWNGSTTSTTTSSFCQHYRSIGNTSYTNNLPPYLVVYMWKRVS